MMDGLTWLYTILGSIFLLVLGYFLKPYADVYADWAKEWFSLKVSLWRKSRAVKREFQNKLIAMQKSEYGRAMLPQKSHKVACMEDVEFGLT